MREALRFDQVRFNFVSMSFHFYDPLSTQTKEHFAPVAVSPAGWQLHSWAMQVQARSFWPSRIRPRGSTVQKRRGCLGWRMLESFSLKTCLGSHVKGDFRDGLQRFGKPLKTVLVRDCETPARCTSCPVHAPKPNLAAASLPAGKPLRRKTIAPKVGFWPIRFDVI